MSIFGTLAPHYWQAGLPAIPLRPGQKAPVLNVWQQYALAMPDEATRAAWLGCFPQHNIGLPLGPQSGVFVLDIDSEDPEIVAQIEALLPPSPWRRVGKKGCALAFRWRDGLRNFKVKNCNGDMVVEGLGQGNQIVLPGSVHPDTGQPYVSDTNLWEVLSELNELPADIADRLRTAFGGENESVRAKSAYGAAISQGGRHDALLSQAGHFVNAGLNGEELKIALQSWNLANCMPPQDEADVDRIVNSAHGWNVNRPGTDMGHGAMLADRIRGRAYFLREPKEWYFFDGRRWKPDPGDLIMREAKAVALERAAMAAANEKSKFRAQSGSALKNMIELAKSEDGILRSITDFDTDLDRLNTPSGIVDLRSGELLPHDPGSLFGQMTAASYEADAKSPVFDRFLMQILPDAEERAFVQRFVGYCLTGHTKEQKFLIASGSGANGKSTLLNVVLAMLGDYAKSTPMMTFIHRKSGAASNDIAALKGARLVLANEGNRGQKLDIALLKQMVGGDPIDSRFLHKEFFTYVPTYKPILISNHLPEIDPTDPAIWRRILVLPFGQSFIGSIDNSLPDQLRSELAGILRWAVEGAVAWYANELSAPTSITAATETYQAEIDVISSFIGQNCDKGSDLEVSASLLYREFSNYCRELNVDVMSGTLFGKELMRRGYPYKQNNTRFRLGLCLKPISADLAA